MRIFAVGFLVSFVAIGQPDWRFAHPDSTLVGSVRPGALMDSSLLASAWTVASPNDPMLAMAKGLASGIKEIRFSLLDNGTPEPEVIALMEGTFDDATLAVLGTQGKYRRIDANTILVGNGPSLAAAEARMHQATPLLQPRVLARTEALADYDLWISGKLPVLPATKGLNLDLRGLALGLSLRGNVEMELVLEAPTAAAAQALLKTVHEAEAAQPANMRGLLQSFADGNTARFHLNVLQSVAMEALRPATLTAEAKAPPPIPTPQPRRATIKIVGLDDGPREIPLH